MFYTYMRWVREIGINQKTQCYEIQMGCSRFFSSDQVNLYKFWYDEELIVYVICKYTEIHQLIFHHDSKNPFIHCFIWVLNI